MSTNNSYKDIAVSRGGLALDDVFVVRNGPDLKTFKVGCSKSRFKVWQALPGRICWRHERARRLGYPSGCGGIH